MLFRPNLSISEPGTSYWNMALTSMMRTENAALFANWAMEGSIHEGALGTVDPETGAFTFMSHLPNCGSERVDVPASVIYSSQYVNRTDADIKFEGGYMDPSKHVEVTVGLETKWTFRSEGTFISQATIAHDALVPDFGSVLQKRFDEVYLVARNHGKTSGDGIVQGFGMITKVRYCVGAANIGAESKDSTFSLTGSVDGVKVMTAQGEFSGKVSGSYKSAKSTGTINRHLFPSTPDVAQSNPMPYAFEFCSFEGKTILPGWTHRVEPLALTFDNAHGGTYIVRCELTYDLPGGKTENRETTVSGGLTGTISQIPFDARSLKVRCTFRGIGSDTVLELFESSPLGTWKRGRRTIDLTGIWPGECGMQWRPHE